MGCEPFQTESARGFICTRGRKTRKKCGCGKVATLLCDAPATKGTCDAPICMQCAISVGPDLHHCPAHDGRPHLSGPTQIGLWQPASALAPASAEEVESMEHDSRLDGAGVREGWPMPWRILPATQLPMEMVLQLHGELSAQERLRHPSQAREGMPGMGK